MTGKDILVLGDSRIAEGFSAKLATEAAANVGSPLTFTSGGIPGSLPRVWYYLLRQIDHPANRLAAVAIMTTSYHDDDPEPQADRKSDIVFVHPLVSLLDLMSFPRSYLHWTDRLEAVEAILFRGFFYKNDVQDFLSDPLERIRQAVAWHKHGIEWISSYPGRNSSLAGLSFDMSSGDLSSPPDNPPAQPNTLAPYAANLRLNHGHFPNNPLATDYRREWFGRIADLCERAGIKLIVFRIPRGPLHYMVDAGEQPSGVLAKLAEAGQLQLLPASAFDSLERPEFFFDDLHLNRAGREKFSVELAQSLLTRALASK